ncbi:unnamed protein product [Cochlearia groenlandica]
MVVMEEERPKLNAINCDLSLIKLTVARRTSKQLQRSAGGYSSVIAAVAIAAVAETTINLMMQSFHHQQLISHLSSGLSPETSASPPPPPTLTPPPSSGTNSSSPLLSRGRRDVNSENIDTGRIAAVKSLHKAITYPPNSLLISHPASFLSFGLWKLLSDKSYEIRQSGVSTLDKVV